VRLVVPDLRARWLTMGPPRSGPSVPLGPDEDRSRSPLADVEFQRPGRPRRQRNNGVLAALADDLERAVPPLVLQVVDAGAESLGDAQAVEGGGVPSAV
jgi:hypothetical protein